MESVSSRAAHGPLKDAGNIAEGSKQEIIVNWTKLYFRSLTRGEGRRYSYVVELKVGDPDKDIVT